MDHKNAERKINGNVDDFHSEPFVHADILTGKVVPVADDHYSPKQHIQHKIRLTGIDAPEKRQAFGNVSKQHLVDMVAGQSAAVEWVKTDKYVRKLGKVLLASLNCNLVWVRQLRELASIRR